MTRRAARISHDEIARMVRAVRREGMSIGAVEFDGEKLRIVVNNGDSGETQVTPPALVPEGKTLLREPKL